MISAPSSQIIYHTNHRNLNAIRHLATRLMNGNGRDNDLTKENGAGEEEKHQRETWCAERTQGCGSGMHFPRYSSVQEGSLAELGDQTLESNLALAIHDTHRKTSKKKAVEEAYRFAQRFSGVGGGLRPTTLS